MGEPGLSRFTSHGVTLIGDESRPGGVTFAYTERTGGVSTGKYASLNLGDACGDDAAAVAENRRRALAALGAEGLAANLVNPRQVHGDHVVVVASADAREVSRAQQEAREGADAVVCTAAGVPVLLCFADCVPVVLVARSAFAVVHSGWRGTVAHISAKALRVLCKAAGAQASQVRAYVGPHIGAADYEVSQDLMDRFVAEFGPVAEASPRHLDLEACIRQTLAAEGVASEQIASVSASTASSTGRFFSYRAEGGACGRHGALAFVPPVEARPAQAGDKTQRS
jgi:YfiH family protein